MSIYACLSTTPRQHTRKYASLTSTTTWPTSTWGLTQAYLWPSTQESKNIARCLRLTRRYPSPRPPLSQLANYVNGDISGCADPPNLNEMALINTAASCTILTKTAPAAATTNTDNQITAIQSGGNQMMTTHAINLLLQNLPPEARLGYRLPCLVDNLLSAAALVDAGWEIFFHCIG